MDKIIYTDIYPKQKPYVRDFELYYVNDLSKIHSDVHSHNFYEISFFLSGEISFRIESEIHDLSPGHVTLLPPGTPHHIHTFNQIIPFSVFVIFISCEYFEKLLQRTDDYGYIFRYSIKNRKYIFQLETAVFGKLQNKIFALLEEQRAERFGKSEQTNVYINDLLLTLNRIFYEISHPIESNGERSLAHDILLYIEKNATKDITLDILAKQFFISKYHISHLFKDTFGITFHQYLTKKRLELVRTALLKNEDISNTFIHYGFKDYSGLFRAFKKEFGMSPKEYQKQNAIRRNV